MRDRETIQVGVASLASKLSESKGWHRSQLAAEQFAKKEQKKLDGKLHVSINVGNRCYIISTSCKKTLNWFLGCKRRCLGDLQATLLPQDILMFHLFLHIPAARGGSSNFEQKRSILML